MASFRSALKRARVGLPWELQGKKTNKPQKPPSILLAHSCPSTWWTTHLSQSVGPGEESTWMSLSPSCIAHPHWEEGTFTSSKARGAHEGMATWKQTRYPMEGK